MHRKSYVKFPSRFLMWSSQHAQRQLTMILSSSSSLPTPPTLLVYWQRSTCTIIGHRSRCASRELNFGSLTYWNEGLARLGFPSSSVLPRSGFDFLHQSRPHITPSWTLTHTPCMQDWGIQSKTHHKHSWVGVEARYSKAGRSNILKCARQGWVNLRFWNKTLKG